MATLGSSLSPAIAYADETGSSVSSIVGNLRSSGHPIGNITTHEVANAGGIVIYLPQEHRDPTSAVNDATNNGAVIAQQQLLEIIDHLNTDDGVKFVMAEGDLYGPIPSAKMDNIKGKVAARDNLKKDAESLRSVALPSGVDTSVRNQAANEVDQLAKNADRFVTLIGAPYELKAEKDSFTLYGAETKELYDKSADLVRNYVYLQDRLSALSGGGINQMGFMNSFDSSQLQTNTGSAIPANTKELCSEASAQGASDIAQICTDVENSVSQMNQQVVDQSATPAPSRSDNPYNNISDRNQLSSLMKKAEQDITDVVINQRSDEAAANFARGLKQEGQPVGILQFGAGHESGLVPALNKQGLSVIVVTPNQVAGGNYSQSLASSQPTAARPSISTNPNISQRTSAPANYAYSNYRYPSPYQQIRTSPYQTMAVSRYSYLLRQNPGTYKMRSSPAVNYQMAK